MPPTRSETERSRLTPEAEKALGQIVGDKHLFTGAAIPEDAFGDECLSAHPTQPLALARPGGTNEVSALLEVASQHGLPVTARGAGTGLSGGCVPQPDGLVICFSRMDQILEIDEANAVAVVQPGVQLDQLDEALKAAGLMYPVYPGEYSASLGGNVNTNAGGMRAVKYGVTRHNVLGVEAVLASGEVLRCGGKPIKVSSGYDLTQLIIGSEGTLALVTEATLKLQPRPAAATTILAPFGSLSEVTSVIPRIVGSGLDPALLEYIDQATMAILIAHVGLELGIPDPIREKAQAYLVIELESHLAARLDEDAMTLGELLAEHGALDIFMLPAKAGDELIAAREKAFWVAKAAGADDILDVVVPRAALPAFMEVVGAIAEETGTRIPGCGHAGDGNVHMAVFQPEASLRSDVLRRIFAAALEMGGAISGEHGLGKTKRTYYLESEAPGKIALQRRLKLAFDPDGLLNPGTVI